MRGSDSPLAAPDAQEPQDENGKCDEEGQENEKGLAALGLEGAAGTRGAGGGVVAGIGEGVRVEAMLAAAGALHEELLALGALTLGLDARGLGDDAVQLLDALLELFLLGEKFFLARIQGAAGFAGTTA